MAQEARRLATGSMAQVRSRVTEGWRFPSLLRVQTAPGVHSAYYKMNTGGQRWLSIGLATLPFPSAVAVIHRYVHPCMHIPHGLSWPITWIPFTMVFLCENVQFFFNICFLQSL